MKNNEAKEGIMGYEKNKPNKYFNVALEKLFFDSTISYPYDADNNATIAKVYPYSNENIADVYAGMDLRGKRVLTVGSSGDQLFEFVCKGCRAVVLIDANILSQPFIELKIAAIKNLSMFEFMDYLTKENIFKHRYYWKVCNDLSPKSREFWDNAMLEYEPKIRETIVNNMVHNNFAINDRKFVNYLKSMTVYETLRNNLSSCKINFINSAFNDFDKKSRGKYDLIVLSNISDYIETNNFFSTVDSLGKSRLNDGGKMQVYYAFLEIPRYTGGFVDSLKESFGIQCGNVSGMEKKSINALRDRSLVGDNVKATTILLDKEFFDTYTFVGTKEYQLEN
ncbi:MAG: DUF3419 family protein [Clostridia bacterium]|nr:DUF3419 family protein [Clostridia bacterium]